MYHDNRGRLSAHYTFLPKMYHDNRGRLSAHHTLLPNMHHVNRGWFSTHHILLPNMYHNNRGIHSFHHTLPLNIHYDNRDRHSFHFTLIPNILHITTCYLTYTFVYLLSQGGFKTVLWTDTVQAVIMFVGILASLIKGSIDVGGIVKVFNISTLGGRTQFSK